MIIAYILGSFKRRGQPTTTLSEGLASASPHPAPTPGEFGGGGGGFLQSGKRSGEFRSRICHSSSSAFCARFGAFVNTPEDGVGKIVTVYELAFLANARLPGAFMATLLSAGRAAKISAFRIRLKPKAAA